MNISRRIYNGMAAFLETLKRLPFVDKVHIDAVEQAGAAGHDAIQTIVDPEKRRFEVSAEIKRSYLDRSLTNAVIAIATRGSKRQAPCPTAERLIDAGVNFVDLVGKSEEKRNRERLSMTGAQMQLLFLFATIPGGGLMAGAGDRRQSRREQE
jgi:hypothetical protein